jgi:hypothetical protein
MHKVQNIFSDFAKRHLPKILAYQCYPRNAGEEPVGSWRNPPGTKTHLPLVRGEVRSQNFQKRAFSGAGGAYNRHHLAGKQLPMPDGQQEPVVVAVDRIPDLQQGTHGSNYR